jgi:hypothetical protein
MGEGCAMTLLRRAVDNRFSRAYLLAVAAIAGWALLLDAMSSGPGYPDVWLALPTLPTSLVGALAVASLGGHAGAYWWLFPVSVVAGAVVNAAVIGMLVHARHPSRPRT